MNINIFLCLLSFIALSTSIQCRDNKNQAKEWIVGYKFPHSFSYATFDSSSPNWRQSEKNIINDGALKNSMNEAFFLKDLPESTYFMYNDAKSGEKYDSKYGHTKGMVAFDKLTNSGIWIIHSIPKLSESSSNYSYPDSGFVYGQNFFCVNLDFSHLKTIVDLFKQSRPYIQNYHVGKDLIEEYPDLIKLTQLVKFNLPEKYDIAKMESFGNDKVEMFAFYKSAAFDKDLYDDLVAVNLNLSFDVETWQHGRNVLPSMCHKDHYVKNIKDISFEKYGIKVNFSEMDDHSKWAISVSKMKATNKNVICIGDINRMESQFNRGGGTLCLLSDKIWSQFKDLPSKVEPCK